MAGVKKPYSGVSQLAPRDVQLRWTRGDKAGSPDTTIMRTTTESRQTAEPAKTSEDRQTQGVSENDARSLLPLCHNDIWPTWLMPCPFLSPHSRF